VPHKQPNLLLRAKLARECSSRPSKHYNDLDVLGKSSIAVAIATGTAIIKSVAAVDSFASTAIAGAEAVVNEVLLLQPKTGLASCAKLIEAVWVR